LLPVRCQRSPRRMARWDSAHFQGRFIQPTTPPNWFETPARDLPRATRFYETVLGRKRKPETMGPQELAIFAYEQPGVGGCLIAGSGHAPAATGTGVYLGVDPGLDEALER